MKVAPRVVLCKWLENHASSQVPTVGGRPASREVSTASTSSACLAICLCIRTFFPSLFFYERSPSCRRGLITSRVDKTWNHPSQHPRSHIQLFLLQALGLSPWGVLITTPTHPVWIPGDFKASCCYPSIWGDIWDACCDRSVGLSLLIRVIFSRFICKMIFRVIFPNCFELQPLHL